jgi:uncharacterized protein DUF6980
MSSMSGMHCCDEMRTHLDSARIAVAYFAKFREYGIRALGCSESMQLMRFCPWCGSALPGSLRNEWFRRLRELELEPESTKLPDEMKTDAWWNIP